MRWEYARHNSRRLVIFCGLLLGCLFFDEAQRTARDPELDRFPQILPAAQATPVSSTARPVLDPLYERDPLAYLKQARRNYDSRVHDYVCDFTKQELLGGTLTPDQVAQAKFREGPFSVYMHITKNAGRARRLLYVKDRIVKNGRQHVLVEPQGPIARLLVNSVHRPVDGRDARRASRRLISEFGFARSLDLLIKYADLSQDKDRLDVRYVGEGTIDGRPTHVLERWLPIDDHSYPWPDARVIIHMDQEWNLPVACYSYADLECKTLLGKYMYTNVHLNVGLQDADFDPRTYGL